MSGNNSNMLITSIANDGDVQKKISQALVDFKKLGEVGGAQAQADLCPQYIANDIVKDMAMLAMRDTLREQEYELEAYQRTLGRRLTDKEVNDFILSHSTPAFFDKSDQKIVDRLNRTIQRSRQITKI
jgi:hypothetical protein